MRSCTPSLTGRGKWLKRIAATGVVLSTVWLCVPTAADERSPGKQTVKVTVPANSAEGYVLKGPFKAGTKLAIQFVAGKWAAWPGDMEEISPDNPSRVSCQALLAERCKPDGPISLLGIIPAGTSITPKVYILEHDTGEILIRMNGKNGDFSRNTGSVQYKLTLAPEE
jgi:hypothetical protein